MSERKFLRSTLCGLLSLSLSLGAAPALAQSTAPFDQFVNRVSSTGLMSPDDLKILMDNRVAFEEKVKILESAKAGDRVYMMYYIHANDETTAKINKAMIDAARRGATVHLMVDFLTNYNNLDMFNMMAKAGQGRIDVRFFNPPTTAIHRDVMYMTMGCGNVPPAQCRQEKEQQIEKAIANDRSQRADRSLIGNGHFFSRLFLAGLSGKKPEALKTAILEGGQVPDMNSASNRKPTDEEKKQLMKFAELLIGAKILHNTTDKIKLAIAMVLYGEDIRPIYQTIDNALPISMRRATPSGKDWEEITQFTHHKLLARISKDGRSMSVINGGRNLENSYHLNENMRSMVAKYLFADTDVKYDVRDASSVRSMEVAIQQLFGYREMVSTLEEINKALPVDYIKEIDLIKKVIAEHKHLKNSMEASAYSELLEGKVREALVGLAEAREKAETTRMMAGIAKYETALARADRTKAQKPFLPEIVERLDPRDKNAEIAYIENLTFRDSTRLEKARSWLSRVFGGAEKADRQRVYDPIAGQETFSNKNIHALWIEWLKQEAAEAARERKVRDIYIHQGYVFLPSNMVKLLGEMMDGTINSEYLRIKILTNSIQTTDLSPMNVLARHQLKALFEYHEQNSGRPGVLKSLDVYEYNRLPDGNKTSLHSKGIFSARSMFIGSANADVRSYETDTNNGLFVKDAPHTARRMMRHFDDLVKDPKVITDVTRTYRRAHSLFLQEDAVIVREIAAKYKSVGERIQLYNSEISSQLIQKMTSVYMMTGLIVDYSGAEHWMGRASTVANPEAPGAAAGAANSCNKVLLSARASRASSAAPKYLNTRSDMFNAIRAMKSKNSPKQIGPLFDRMMQLI